MQGVPGVLEVPTTLQDLMSMVSSVLVVLAFIRLAVINMYFNLPVISNTGCFLIQLLRSMNSGMVMRYQFLVLMPITAIVILQENLGLEILLQPITWT